MSPAHHALSWLRPFTRDPVHGPLPGLLLLLTVTTGLVDAVSILSLGRVFVANMTGNVVFVAFGLAGAPGFSLLASVVALAGFLCGAAGGGLVVKQRSDDRAGLLALIAPAEFLLLLVAALILLIGPLQPGTAARSVVVAAAALALGAQNAAARSLAVPDLTTTVLTMTLTGIAADLRSGKPVLRRLLAVGAMFGGAILGAALDLNHHPGWAMLIAALLAGVVGLYVAVSVRRGPAAWHVRPSKAGS